MLACRAMSHRPRGRTLVRSSNGSKFADGAAVKVVKSVKVYHVPKIPELDLEGLQGTFVKDVNDFKGKQLSANLPLKVAFQIEKDGASVKFQAHLVGSRARPPRDHAWPCMHATLQAGCPPPAPGPTMRLPLRTPCRAKTKFRQRDCCALSSGCSGLWHR